MPRAAPRVRDLDGVDGGIKTNDNAAVAAAAAARCAASLVVGRAASAGLATQYARVTETLAAQRISIVRVLLSLVSYALLLTDTMRTGFAVRRLEDFAPFETDAALSFGPFAYSVSSTRNPKSSFVVNTTTSTTTTTASETATRLPFWPYKYDSTSIIMRALVQHLGVRGWPPCVLYHERCDERRGLAPADVFTMLDALIDAVKRHRPAYNSQRRAAGRSGQLTVRATSVWVDRLTDRVLPWLFLRVPRRTGRAIVFDAARDGRRQLCGHELPRPLLCHDLWTRLPLDRRRPRRSPWDSMVAHVRELHASQPTTHAESLLLEGMDDFSRGGLLFQGHRYYEVVMLTRLRQCSRAGVCETVAVDDFRFESAVVVAGVTHWANVLSLLRGVAQLYLWVRVLALSLGIVASVAATPQRTRRRWRLGVKLACLVPSQVVVYGAALPIACYAVAHVLDAMVMQEFMYGHLNTIQGFYQLKVRKILEIGAVALRSVWLVALACHVVARLSRREHQRTSGRVGGIPELFITVIASASVLAQMRVKSWRDSRVLAVSEVARHAAHAVLQTTQPTRGLTAWDHTLIGAKIDAQFVVVSALGVVALQMTLCSLRWLAPRCVLLRMRLVASSSVPFSCGALWSHSMLVVSWFGAIVTLDRRGANGRTDADDDDANTANTVVSWTQRQRRQAEDDEPRKPSLKAIESAVRRVSSTISSSHALLTDDGVVGSDATLRDLGARSRCMDATIFLMNLTMMTDPLTWLSLRWWQGGVLLGVYRFRAPSPASASVRWFLLPTAVATQIDELSTDDGDGRELNLELETIVRSCDVTWPQLLLAG
ncbi:hypothetical protein PINS_up005595 [Pythium insidiosum]|nr:hypothetical protein PINS_up005595 [Pythium insidiosum]